VASFNPQYAVYAGHTASHKTMQPALLKNELKTKNFKQHTYVCCMQMLALYHIGARTEYTVTVTYPLIKTR